MITIAYYTFLGLLVLPALDYFLGLRVLPDVKTSEEKDLGSPVAGDGISAVIACHNEVNNIERKVGEIADQFSDAGVVNFEIIVVSDGSTDGSNKTLESLDAQGVIRYILVENRSGKPNALNIGIASSKFPLLLLSDVRQTFSKGAISALLSHLSDPQIGAVSSQLELEGNSSPARRWMNGLKLRESRKGSTTGMCGALYIMRKELVEHLPEDTILDDLLMSLFVMKNGKRVVLEPSAIVHDVSFDKFYSGRRQGRITAGLVQILTTHKMLLTQIGLVQLIFLYGQKYLKYTAPVLFAIASILALFSDQITTWHYSVTLVLLTVITITKPLFVAQALRLTLSYMAQLLKLDKYTKVKWER